MLVYLLAIPPGAFVVFAFLYGAIIGSFINAAIYRLPRNISMLTRSRSFCPRCEHKIAWYDNLPLLSYVLLLGRCRGCKERIPFRYLHVETLCATLFAIAAWSFFILNRPPTAGSLSLMPTALFLVQLFLIADLICIAFTDWETFYIPFQTTLPWILVGLIVAPVFPELHLSATQWTGSPRLNAFVDSFQGLVLGAGSLWLIGFGCIIVLGKQGMGGGDSHLVGMVGALLGWKPALATLLLGFLIGCATGIGQILWDRLQKQRLGDKWVPRKPAFELPEEEGEPEVPEAWPLLVMGLIVVVFEGALLISWFVPGTQAPAQQPVSYQELLQSSEFVHLTSFPGLIIGLFLLLAFPMQKRMVAAGKWPLGEVREREDGKKEEVLEGNYIPFGPSLALAALIVVFYDPAIRSFAVWWTFGFWPKLPHHLPWVG